MAYRGLAWAAVLAAATAACLDQSGPTASEQILQANMARWSESGPDSYDLTLERDCICSGGTGGVQVRVEVRNEVVTGRFFVTDDSPVPSDQTAAYPDVPGLFALIRDAIDRKVLFLNADFNEALGYPTVIQIDYGTGAANSVIFLTLNFAAVE